MENVTDLFSFSFSMITADNFESYRLAFFVGIFIFVFILQMVIPFRKGGLKTILSNWKVNLSYGVLNTFIIGILCGGCVVTLAVERVESGRSLIAGYGGPLVIQILLSVLILDGVAYIWHRLNHTIPFLWRFHATHHSDNLIDSSSAIRFHPGEVLISLVLRFAVVWLLGIPLVGLFIFELIFLTSNFVEHSYVRLPAHWERRLQWLLVTPALHRWHHSVNWREANSNYGTIFSFWDRIFKSLQSVTEIHQFKTGLPGHETKAFGLLKSLMIPVREGKR